MTHTFLNQTTVESLDSASSQDMPRGEAINAFIEKLKADNGLEEVFRFDIGSNIDGCSPNVQSAIKHGDIPELTCAHFRTYPDELCKELRQKLADKFQISHEWILMTAGLETALDHICRSVLLPGDSVLMPVPNFPLFEDASRKAGAAINVIPLDYDGLEWTDAITEKMLEGIRKHSPKLLWISNPINPTGRFIEHDALHAVIAYAHEHGAVVVVDEAYGEYTDEAERPCSMAESLKLYPNLIVLRTFSKIHGLPAARVGYVMCANEQILKGIAFYRPSSPLSWFSLHAALIAARDSEYLTKSRTKLADRRHAFLTAVAHLENFEFLDSWTNTILFRHKYKTADELGAGLEKAGILTANLEDTTGVPKGYRRMTIRTMADNAHLFTVLKELD